MSVRKFDHLAFVVGDLDEAVAHFAALLGVADEDIFYERGYEAGAERLDLAFMEVDRIWIELVEPLDSDGQLGRWLARTGGGLHHIGVTADPVRDAWRDHVARASELGLLNERPEVDSFGSSYWFLHPAKHYGTLIEVQAAWKRTPESNMTPVEPTPDWSLEPPRPQGR